MPGTPLTGLTVSATYNALLKTTDNGNVTASLKTITDGLGNDSALQVSSAGVKTTGTFAADGAATLSSTLAVTGASTLTGNASLGGTLSVAGAATLSSTLAVTGTSTLTGNASLGGTLSVTGAATLSSTLAVTGTSTLTGNASLGGTLSVTGAATLSSTLAVTGTSTLTGNASLGGTLSVTGATTLAAVSATTVTASGVLGGPNGSVSAPAFTFTSDTDLGVFRYGANQLGIAGQIYAFNGAADNAMYLGQGASNNLAFAWTYNATPASASAVFGTFGKSNNLTIQAKTINFDSSSLAFAVQVVDSGRVRVGGGSDDGVNDFQVNGYANADKYTANPTTLTYGATTTIDFSAATCQTVTLTGNVTFATSNLVAGRAKKLRVVASGGPWTISIPGWKNLNGSVPASIASGKTAELCLFSWGTTDADVSASYAVTS